MLGKIGLEEALKMLYDGDYSEIWDEFGYITETGTRAVEALEGVDLLIPVVITDRYGRESTGYLDNRRMLIYTKPITAEIMKTCGYSWKVKE